MKTGVGCSQGWKVETPLSKCEQWLRQHGTLQWGRIQEVDTPNNYALKPSKDGPKAGHPSRAGQTTPSSPTFDLKSCHTMLEMHHFQISTVMIHCNRHSWGSSESAVVVQPRNDGATAYLIEPTSRHHITAGNLHRLWSVRAATELCYGIFLTFIIYRSFLLGHTPGL